VLLFRVTFSSNPRRSGAHPGAIITSLHRGDSQLKVSCCRFRVSGSLNQVKPRSRARNLDCILGKYCFGIDASMGGTWFVLD
jgi:hypothetical protein